MTRENARFLRSIGISTPRLEENSEEMWSQQNSRLNALLAVQEVALPAPWRDFLPPPGFMKNQCVNALNNAIERGRGDPAYLYYIEQQLWDIVEYILNGDGYAQRRLSHTTVQELKQLLHHRVFANTTFVEFLQLAEAWNKLFHNQFVAFEENTLSWIGTMFSQILTEQALTKELAMFRQLKREKIREAPDEPCAICFENPQAGEYVTSLQPHCRHWFHSVCINYWLTSGSESSDRCPICRCFIPFNREVPPPADPAMNQLLFWEDNY